MKKGTLWVLFVVVVFGLVMFVSGCQKKEQPAEQPAVTEQAPAPEAQAPEAQAPEATAPEATAPAPEAAAPADTAAGAQQPAEAPAGTK